MTKVSEGTWLDFDGNAFGSGSGSGFVLEAGRYGNWGGSEPNNARNEDYADATSHLH